MFSPENEPETGLFPSAISGWQLSAPISDMSLALRMRGETHMRRMSLIARASLAHMRRI